MAPTPSVVRMNGVRSWAAFLRSSCLRLSGAGDRPSRISRSQNIDYKFAADALCEASMWVSSSRRAPHSKGSDQWHSRTIGGPGARGATKSKSRVHSQGAAVCTLVPLGYLEYAADSPRNKNYAYEIMSTLMFETQAMNHYACAFREPVLFLGLAFRVTNSLDWVHPGAMSCSKSRPISTY